MCYITSNAFGKDDSRTAHIDSIHCTDRGDDCRTLRADRDVELGIRIASSVVNANILLTLGHFLHLPFLLFLD